MKSRVFLASLLALGVSTVSASAQSYQLKQGSFALKSGEGVEVGDLYWVINCRSQLTGPIQVAILEGPPGVTASVAEASVLPRSQKCAQPVKGGKLTLKVGTVEDESDTMMTLRITYPTKDGNRQQSMSVSVALFP